MVKWSVCPTGPHLNLFAQKTKLPDQIVPNSPKNQPAEASERSGIARAIRYFRYNAIRFFRIRAASERIARGFALGMIINFLPTFGFGVLISGFFARMFGGHMIAGLIGGASLTFAWPILFIFNIRAGSWILQIDSPVNDSAAPDTELPNQLLWGRVFILGMTANMLSAGLAVYLVIRLLYRRVRPWAIALLRRRVHRRPRRKKNATEIIR